MGRHVAVPNRRKLALPAAAEVTPRSRTKALVWGIATGLGSRLLMLIAPLLTIPVTLSYLGAEVFGFWMVIVSITSMAMFADLGLGNGLLTCLGRASAERDYAKSKVLISTAYLTLAGVSLLILASVWLLVPHLDWASVLGTNAEPDAEVIQSVAILCLSAFAVSVPLSLIQRVQYALQEAWKSNLWQVAGAAATVVTVYVMAWLDLGPVAVVAASVFALPLILLLNTVCYFVGRPELRPGFAGVSMSAAGSLLRIGLAFFALSILTSVALNVDNVIVSNLADLPTVSDYAVATKLFSLLGLAVTLVALPLWPANADALARGDINWVKKITFKMSLISVGAVGLGGAVLVSLRDSVTALWLGEGHTIALPLAINLVVSSMLMAFSSPFFTVQNSVGRLNLQFLGWALFIGLSIPLKFYFYGLFGLPGVPLGTSVAYIFALVPVALGGYRATIRRVEAHNAF